MGFTRWIAWGLGFACILGIAFVFDDWFVDILARPISSGQLQGVLRAMRCWGEGATLAILAAGVGCALREWKRPTALVVVALLAGGCVSLIKPLFSRPRPAVVLAERSANGNPNASADATWEAKWNSSFPSGHTATAFAFARSLAMVAPSVAPVAFLAASGTGLSRMYEQRHYFSDCVAGAGVGVLIAQLFWTFIFSGNRSTESLLPALRPKNRHLPLLDSSPRLDIVAKTETDLASEPREGSKNATANC